MMGFINAQYVDMPVGEIDLIDAARILCKSPIGRKRLIEQLEQQGAVHSVVAYQNDRII